MPDTEILQTLCPFTSGTLADLLLEAIDKKLSLQEFHGWTFSFHHVSK
jgi:hypothetical protein